MKKSIVCLLLSGLVWTASAGDHHWHDDEDHWKRHSEHEDADDRGFDHRAGGHCYFEPHDLRVIREYYAPGHHDLPPGLERKLYRTGHLPPGWEARMEPLPVVVERELVPIPAGYRRGMLDGYAVIYSPRTQVVIDVSAVFGWR